MVYSDPNIKGIIQKYRRTAPEVNSASTTSRNRNPHDILQQNASVIDLDDPSLTSQNS